MQQIGAKGYHQPCSGRREGRRRPTHERTKCRNSSTKDFHLLLLNHGTQALFFSCRSLGDVLVHLEERLGSRVATFLHERPKNDRFCVFRYLTTFCPSFHAPLTALRDLCSASSRLVCQTLGLMALLASGLCGSRRQSAYDCCAACSVKMGWLNRRAKRDLYSYAWCSS